MFKILIADKLAQEGVDLLNSMDDVRAVVQTGMSEDELAGVIGDYDGVIVRSASTISAKVLANPGKLKGIARAGVGVDNIDITEATKKGIIVMNTPGGNTQSTAEHTLALMLAMSRNVVPACNSLKAGAWDRKKYTGNQLNGKVLGVIGLGRIGMAVAAMAKGFNMKILGYDTVAVPADAEKLGIEVTEKLERIYKESDYITLHVPKNKQTVNMIAAEQFGMMKPSVRLINCARGGIINEDALYDALTENRIAGAALDVYSIEPPENTRFKDLENCLVTPHLGASTAEAQIEVAVEAAQILVDAIKGGAVCNALNAPSTSGVMPPAVRRYAELAGRIGKVVSTITPGRIRNIAIQYRGTIAEQDVKLVTLNFAIGLLQQHFDLPLNTVNVSVLAKERGISIDETKNEEAKDVAASFSARVVTDKMTRTVTGSVFGETQLRIIEVDGFDAEVTPQGSLIIIFNDDKPGIIGSVGTICGNHNINICTMGVGQKPAEQKAVLAVSVDREPDEKVIEEIGRLDFVNEIYVCKLD